MNNSNHQIRHHKYINLQSDLMNYVAVVVSNFNCDKKI